MGLVGLVHGAAGPCRQLIGKPPSIAAAATSPKRGQRGGARGVRLSRGGAAGAGAGQAGAEAALELGFYLRDEVVDDVLQDELRGAQLGVQAAEFLGAGGFGAALQGALQGRLRRLLGTRRGAGCTLGPGPGWVRWARCPVGQFEGRRFDDLGEQGMLSGSTDSVSRGGSLLVCSSSRARIDSRSSSRCAGFAAVWSCPWGVLRVRLALDHSRAGGRYGNSHGRPSRAGSWLTISMMRLKRSRCGERLASG